MRISDWSADVCSSDLPHPAAEEPGRPHAAPARRRAGVPFRAGRAGRRRRRAGAAREALSRAPDGRFPQRGTTETRLVGGFTQYTRTPCWRAGFSTSSIYRALVTVLVSVTAPLSTAARSEEHTSELQ